MYPNARIQGNPAPRSVPDLLETLKSEFDNIAHEGTMYKMQRDEFERKLQSQLQELNNIQSAMFDLERAYQKMKQQDEEDIL
jgi:glucose repression regulatory protein TUP1